MVGVLPAHPGPQPPPLPAQFSNPRLPEHKPPSSHLLPLLPPAGDQNSLICLLSPSIFPPVCLDLPNLSPAHPCYLGQIYYSWARCLRYLEGSMVPGLQCNGCSACMLAKSHEKTPDSNLNNKFEIWKRSKILCNFFNKFVPWFGYSIHWSGLAISVVNPRPLSVHFLFCASGKGTDTATMLRLEKYGEIKFSLWKCTSTDHNAIKWMRAYAKGSGTFGGTYFRLFFRSWQLVF